MQISSPETDQGGSPSPTGTPQPSQSQRSQGEEEQLEMDLSDNDTDQDAHPRKTQAHQALEDDLFGESEEEEMPTLAESHKDPALEDDLFGEEDEEEEEEESMEIEGGLLAQLERQDRDRKKGNKRYPREDPFYQDGPTRDRPMNDYDEEEEEEEGDDLEDESSSPIITHMSLSLKQPSASKEIPPQYNYLRLPKSILIDNVPFDPSTYANPLKGLDPSMALPLLRRIRNTIRVRKAPSSEMEGAQPDSRQGKVESNARLVRWNDGSMTLHIGKEAPYLVRTRPMAGAGVRHLLVAESQTGSVVRAVRRLTRTMELEQTAPYTHDSMLKRGSSLTESSMSTSGDREGQGGRKQQLRTKMITTLVDPEREKEKQIRLAKEKERMRRRQETARRARESAADGYGLGGGGRGGAWRRGTVDALEAEEDEDLGDGYGMGDRRGPGAAGGGGPDSYLEDDFVVGDEEVFSEEDGEEEEEEEDEEEEEEDEEEEEMRARRALKAKKRGMKRYGGDEDDEGTSNSPSQPPSRSNKRRLTVMSSDEDD
ncbi:Leo1-like protein-domain-containing protein [Piptocephalis cylindrospora]|uniref:Leo1-like protein-domain-containing protein n=1 Tax=Piptocephalis cylindrospora TaxID=1907219 RepID=A0A4P9Y459_9FUNG|nr:Leo1-like protein-domain-containing protein [Piptocephalis cylindrospora]|eukprot:RKP13695.1 Leo1-like protein-domain-containing protein [Piptocephalis cylindrospora]